MRGSHLQPWSYKGATGAVLLIRGSHLQPWSYKGATGAVLLVQEYTKTMHSQTDLVVGVDEHCALATARPHGEQVCQKLDELVHLSDVW